MSRHRQCHRSMSSFQSGRPFPRRTTNSTKAGHGPGGWKAQPSGLYCRHGVRVLETSGGLGRQPPLAGHSPTRRPGGLHRPRPRTTSSARLRPRHSAPSAPASTRPLPRSADPPRPAAWILVSRCPCARCAPTWGLRWGWEPPRLIWSLWPRAKCCSGGLLLGQRKRQARLPCRGRGRCAAVVARLALSLSGMLFSLERHRQAF